MGDSGDLTPLLQMPGAIDGSQPPEVPGVPLSTQAPSGSQPPEVPDGSQPMGPLEPTQDTQGVPGSQSYTQSQSLDARASSAPPHLDPAYPIWQYASLPANQEKGGLSHSPSRARMPAMTEEPSSRWSKLSKRLSVIPGMGESQQTEEPHLLSPSSETQGSRATSPREQLGSTKSFKDGYSSKGAAGPALACADMHIIGEIVGASGFKSRQPALSCRWRLVYDSYKTWAVVRGLQAGCTHCANQEVRSKWPMSTQESIIVWEHPLDIHMTTQRLEGWPSLMLMVYERDEMSERDFFISYAICPLPTTAGMHHVSTRTWYPVEPSMAAPRNLFAWYMGMAPRLHDESEDLRFLMDVSKRPADTGQPLASVGAGTVHLRVQLLFRNMAEVSQQSSTVSLHKSLETFQETMDLSRQKEMSKMAAMQEYSKDLVKRNETVGLKQVRQGREERFEAARQQLEARRDRHRDPHRSRSADPRDPVSLLRASDQGYARRDSVSAPRERTFGPPVSSQWQQQQQQQQARMGNSIAGMTPWQQRQQRLEQAMVDNSMAVDSSWQQQQRQQQQQQQPLVYNGMAMGSPWQQQQQQQQQQPLTDSSMAVDASWKQQQQHQQQPDLNASSPLQHPLQRHERGSPNRRLTPTAPFVLQPPRRDGEGGVHSASQWPQESSVEQPSVKGDNSGGYAGSVAFPDQAPGSAMPRQPQAFGSVDQGLGWDSRDGRSSSGWQEERDVRVRRRQERRMQ